MALHSNCSESGPSKYLFSKKVGGSENSDDFRLKVFLRSNRDLVCSESGCSDIW